MISTAHRRPNPPRETERESLGSARADALRKDMDARDKAATATTRARAAVKTVEQVLPIILEGTLPEGDVLSQTILEISEGVSAQEPGTTPELIAREIDAWLEQHPDTRKRLERTIGASFGIRFDRLVASLPLPETDEEIEEACDRLSETLLRDHVRKSWLRERVKDQRRVWKAEVRDDRKNWALLEKMLPERDVATIREITGADEITFRSRAGDPASIAEHLSDRVRHAIGVVMMNAEKRRIHDAVSNAARSYDPIRTARSRVSGIMREIAVLREAIPHRTRELASAREERQRTIADERTRLAEKLKSLRKPMGAAIAKAAALERKAASIPEARRETFEAELAAASSIAAEYARQYDESLSPKVPEHDARVSRIEQEANELGIQLAGKVKQAEEAGKEAARMTMEHFDGVRAAIAGLPSAAHKDRQAGHRAFTERLTFLGVKPSQDDWEQYLRSFEAAVGGEIKTT